MSSVVSVKNLNYKYSRRGVESNAYALKDVNIEIPEGARVLVVGQNGAGKSTLLRIIAGRVLVPKDSVHVCGRQAFHDTKLVEDISYLGEWWAQTRNFLDVTVKQILPEEALTSERVKKLCEVLRVNLDWPLAQLSDGQLRRAQILFGLADKKKLVILDEITTDVDILVRDAIQEFLKSETTTESPVTVMYATHIFDGIEEWDPTHVLRVTEGVVTLTPASEIKELQNSSFYNVVKGWLKAERRVEETSHHVDWQNRAEGLRIL
eukprot:TRINITY_DN24208_c0_g1_i1.p1 TRINITY_DN24208_c0_g1~~TRINITY_DN24208_c0_g1_i1.p1  ORF type:complete len:264 (+),score=52.55 TRINITY_DN24208_c0_g1_i1:50-841(+)